MKFIIDGFDTDKFGLDPDLFMHYLTAEDIKGIEIMYTADYALRYDPDFITKEATWPDQNVPVYLEVTTRSGHGAFFKKTNVNYVYNPIPFSMPKEFYRPRYTVKSVPNGTDQRSTIHWAPNVVTGADGRAMVSFYSADKPAGYTIKVQGADLNGQLGFAWKRIMVR